MSFFKKLARATVGVVISPVDVVKDIATMGGVLNDKDEPYTVARAKQVARDISSLPDEID